MAAKKLLMLVVSDKTHPLCSGAHSVLSRLTDKVDFLFGSSLEEFQTFPQLPEARAMLWIPPGNTKILPDLMQRAPHIEWIHSWFVGVDALHPFIKQCLLNTSIPLTNARGAYSRALAEYTMCVALHYEKQVPLIMRNTKDKVWDQYPMGELRGKSMGFVGFGDIAKTTARVAKEGFGMKILALRRRPSKGDEGLAETVFDSNNEDETLELFRRSDYLVSSLPATPETRLFINGARISAMKPSAIFISIGRGSVVDEEALAVALKDRRIKGAALDVFQREPLNENSPLWSLENILITAHNADWVQSYQDCALEIMKKNLQRFINGARTEEEMCTPVDKTAGY